MSRYENRTEIVNDLDRYKNLFKNRGVNFIRMYKTPVFKHLTTEEIKEITVITHQWSSRDTFYKLAYHHYGDPTLWWVIAWYNGVAMEAEIVNGDLLEIPVNLRKTLEVLGV